MVVRKQQEQHFLTSCSNSASFSDIMPPSTMLKRPVPCPEPRMSCFAAIKFAKYFPLKIWPLAPRANGVFSSSIEPQGILQKSLGGGGGLGAVEGRGGSPSPGPRAAAPSMPGLIFTPPHMSHADSDEVLRNVHTEHSQGSHIAAWAGGGGTTLEAGTAGAKGRRAGVTTAILDEGTIRH